MHGSSPERRPAIRYNARPRPRGAERLQRCRALYCGILPFDMRAAPMDANDKQAMLLQWLGSAEDSRKWPLPPGLRAVIGRDRACDVVLDNRLVSRRHAEIYWQDGDCFIRDLDSKNGTRINGQALKHDKRLQDGDEVQVALRFKLAFVSEDATADLAWESRPRGIELNPATRAVALNGQVMDPPLSYKQFRLLHVLWKAGGGVVSRTEIKRAVWPQDAPDGVSRQSIDALVRRLRETLAALDPHTEYLVTVRGHGYRLERG